MAAHSYGGPYLWQAVPDVDELDRAIIVQVSGVAQSRYLHMR